MYVRIEFEDGGKRYTYRSDEKIIVGDSVIVDSPIRGLVSVKVVGVGGEGDRKWCIKDRFKELAEADDKIVAFKASVEDRHFRASLTEDERKEYEGLC